MGFIIGLLTFFMILDCIVLVFLVLIQLPKKEAGAGLAFGGAASDALFGAGSGNVLTKITKYAATIFFVMAVLLSILQTRHYGRTTSVFQQKLEQPITAPGGAVPAPAPGKNVVPGPAPVLPPATNNPLIITPQAESTNTAPAAGANAVPAK
jgi:preprotein translocase subunit SecG